MAGMLPGVEYARRRRFHQGGSLDPHNQRTRRSSFRLYQSDNIHHLHQHSKAWETRSAVQAGRTEQKQQQNEESKLQDAAREARERLDERLRTTTSSSNGRRGGFTFWCRNSSKNNCESDPGGNNCEEVRSSRIRGWFSSAVSMRGRSGRRSEGENGVEQSSSGGVMSKASIDLVHREGMTFANKESGKYSWKRLHGRNSEEGECPVCLEAFGVDNMLILLPCAHKFHSTCLIPWLNSHCHCPYCRAEISVKAS